MAAGQILSWLNADDVLHPGAVRAVVEEFRSDSEAMMVYGQADFIDATGLPIEPLRHVEPFNLDRLIDVHDYIVQPAAFVRREALAAVGYVDETLHWSMDWDLWIRIGQRFPVRYLPVPLATVRLHAETKTSRAGFSKLREMHRHREATQPAPIPAPAVDPGRGNPVSNGAAAPGCAGPDAPAFRPGPVGVSADGSRHRDGPVPVGAAGSGAPASRPAA